MSNNNQRQVVQSALNSIKEAERDFAKATANVEHQVKALKRQLKALNSLTTGKHIQVDEDKLTDPDYLNSLAQRIGKRSVKIKEKIALAERRLRRSLEELQADAE